MAVSETDDGGLKGRADRFGAMANYVLLIIAPFTLGILALLAVAIAYLRRRSAHGLARSHYDYQIRSFWMDLALVALGALCGWAALASGLGSLSGVFGISLPAGLSSGELGWTAFALGAAWVVLWLWGLLGLVFGSVHGSMRLAAGRPMGKTRRP